MHEAPEPAPTTGIDDGPRLPDFVLIGAQKCGTGTLYHRLRSNSGIFMSDPKEPQFFSKNYGRGLAGYAALFADAPADRLCGEASTTYTFRETYPETASRMHRHIPEARLIYVMRDPIARLVSAYIHDWSQGRTGEGIDAFLRSSDDPLLRSSYAWQLEPWLDAYGPERILPVFLEQVARDPIPELRRICAFIGTPDAHSYEWERDVPPRNVSRDRIRRGTLYYALARRPTVLGLVPRGIQRALEARARIRERPSISPSLRAEIAERLDADLERLGRWLDRELSCDGWAEQVGEDPPAWGPAAPRPG